MGPSHATSPTHPTEQRWMTVLGGTLIRQGDRIKLRGVAAGVYWGSGYGYVFYPRDINRAWLVDRIIPTPDGDVEVEISYSKRPGWGNGYLRKTLRKSQFLATFPKVTVKQLNTGGTWHGATYITYLSEGHVYVFAHRVWHLAGADEQVPPCWHGPLGEHGHKTRRGIFGDYGRFIEDG